LGEVEGYEFEASLVYKARVFAKKKKNQKNFECPVLPSQLVMGQRADLTLPVS
jgi:hypothetical protein